MTDQFVLAKSSFPDFFKAMQKLGKVFAPVTVSAKSFAFREVTAPEQIAYQALRTILPPKKFFYPQEEVVVRYENDEIVEVNPEPDFKVILGVHPCDLAGLGIMDTIFAGEPADSHYANKRAASLIVGFSCMPDKHCFCFSMGTHMPEKGYDLFLTDLGDEYMVEVRTAAGAKAVEPLQALLREPQAPDLEADSCFWENREKAFTTGFNEPNLSSLFEKEWNNKVWEELGQRCLSCGSCTPVCPTCYCFDLVDIASLDGESGERHRQWDSCQFVGFAQVAGDFNFRPGPVDRLKFWYKHKLHGFDDPYGFKTCVGCGRCTESCPAGIDDIVHVVKIMQSSQEESREKAN